MTRSVDVKQDPRGGQVENTLWWERWGGTQVIIGGHCKRWQWLAPGGEKQIGSFWAWFQGLS